MPWLTLPNGMTAHVRMAKPRRRRCCGTEGGHPCPTPAAFQCDFAVSAGKTCDAWCCRAHASSVGPDIDHCPGHAQRQAGLFTGLKELQT